MNRTVLKRKPVYNLKDSDNFNQFVNAIEGLISGENSRWSRIIENKPEGE